MVILLFLLSFIANVYSVELSEKLMSDEEVQSFYHAHRLAIDEIAHSQKMHTAYALIDFVNQRMEDIGYTGIEDSEYKKETKKSFSDLGSYYGCLILSALNGRGFGGLSTTKVASTEEASTACFALFIIGANLAFCEPLPFFPIQPSMPAEHKAHYSLINNILNVSSGHYDKSESEDEDPVDQLFTRIFPKSYKNLHNCSDVYDYYVLESIKIGSFEKSTSWSQIYQNAISNLKSEDKLTSVTGLEFLIEKTNRALSNLGDERWKLILKSEGKLNSVAGFESLIEKTHQHIRHLDEELSKLIKRRNHVGQEILAELSTLKAELRSLGTTSIVDTEKRLREMDTRHIEVREDDINYARKSPFKEILEDEDLINIIQAIHQLGRISPFKAAINGMSTHITRGTATAGMEHDRVFAADISQSLNIEQIKIALEMAFKHPLLSDLFDVSSDQIKFKGTTQEKILTLVTELSRFPANPFAKTLTTDATTFLNLIQKVADGKPVALASSTHPTFIKGLDNIQARDQALEELRIKRELLKTLEKKIAERKAKLGLFYNYSVWNGSLNSHDDDQYEAIKPGFKELTHQIAAMNKEIKYFDRLKNLLKEFILIYHIESSYFNPLS